MTRQPFHHDADDVLLDCIGQRCPLPVLRARKALAGLVPGVVLRVESSDPVAIVDIPHMAREDGHEVIASRIEGERASFRIRRGPG